MADNSQRIVNTNRLRPGRRGYNSAPWVILLPILLYYSIFALVPVILNIAVSFTNWNGISDQVEWVGFQNYARYLKPPYPQIFINTLYFAVRTLVLQTILALLIAVLLNQKLRGIAIYRSVWYIPTLAAGAIMAQVVIVFISPYDGVLNKILQALGYAPQLWTINADALRGFIIGFTIWRGLGTPIVLFLAGLHSIEPETYEAATVDGAGVWTTFWYITLPLLRPMLVFILVTGIINGIQIFDSVLVISKGGPQNTTNVLLLQIYYDAFVNGSFGLASAGATIMALLLLGFTVTLLRFHRAEGQP